jgi:hypothetical protein
MGLAVSRKGKARSALIRGKGTTPAIRTSCVVEGGCFSPQIHLAAAAKSPTRAATEAVWF